MRNENEHPKSLIEAVRYFSDADVCHRYMVGIKWPSGTITCPKCDGESVGEIKSRRMFQCRAKGCRKQFSTKVGTIFEDSALGLDKWFVAVWCIANCKNGISSHELGRTLDITQKSAWHVLHRIRLAMSTGTFRKMSGEVESDESYIGGLAKNMHKSRRAEKIKGSGYLGKQIVQGILERGGDLRIKHVANPKRPTLHREIYRHVEPGSSVYTDSLKSYVGLDRFFIHRMIDHAKTYVEGRVHTNGLENFWSLLKRAIRGTYVWVSPEHLQAYLDEQAQRFNHRKMNDGQRFLDVLANIVGRRLRYDELTSRVVAA